MKLKDISATSDTPEETQAKVWEYAMARVGDLMALMRIRFDVTEEQAANELLMAVVAYANTNCAGPFEEPLKSEVETLREIERGGRRDA